MKEQRGELNRISFNPEADLILDVSLLHPGSYIYSLSVPAASRWTVMCFEEVSPTPPLPSPPCRLLLLLDPRRGEGGGVFSARCSDALGVQTRRHPDDPPPEEPLEPDDPARLKAPLAKAEPSESLLLDYRIVLLFATDRRRRRVMMLRMRPRWWISLLCVCGLMHVAQSSPDALNGN